MVTNEPDNLFTALKIALSPENLQNLQMLRDIRKQNRLACRWARYANALEHAPLIRDIKVSANQAVITLDSKTITPSQSQQLLTSLQEFCPWKKGPFSVFGHQIDSEWRSDIKWQRIDHELGDLTDQNVCDIGCNNGYFLWRLAARANRPRIIVGIEPMAAHWYSFQLLQRYIGLEGIYFEPFGVEHLDLMPDCFDTILCLGILYHHTDPVGLLRKMKTSLKKNGRLVIDCQGIEGSDPLALVPQGRYAGASGIWFLPTVPALIHWIRRAGYQDVRCFYSAKLTPEEQRPTSWAEIKSLSDYLSPDQATTIEGYPAPWRHYVVAR